MYHAYTDRYVSQMGEKKIQQKKTTQSHILMSASDLIDKVFIVHGGETLPVLQAFALKFLFIGLAHGIQC